VDRTELESAPSLLGLYSRAAAGAVLPGGGEGLPDREVTLERAALDPARVADYARVCGFGIRDDAPGTYPHILAFPLQLELMTAREFPVGVLGLVHIGNEIEVRGELPVGSTLDLAVHAADLRPHPRGRQFDLISEGGREGEVCWRGRSTYLHRGDGSGEGREDMSDEGPPMELSATWRIPGDIGRRYGAVSGDRNPIHMHSLSARLFGFPSAIAHGMWTKARCLAAFEGRIRAPYRIAVEFKAPLRVPAVAHLMSARRKERFEFQVESGEEGRVHARGEIEPV
jgi:acyl dehydratase